MRVPNQGNPRAQCLRFDTRSPFLRTFNQIFQNVAATPKTMNNNFYYVTYNDQPAGNNYYNDAGNKGAPSGGHTKGFFIWNDQGGIHVTHSIPDVPRYRSNIDANGNPIPGRGARGQFEWNNIVPGNAGLESYRLTSRTDGEETDIPANRIYQHSLHAYCYRIPTIEQQITTHSYVHRFLVMTNAIIGIVNDLEVRKSLSSLNLGGIILDGIHFPRVNLAKLNTISANYKIAPLSVQSIQTAIDTDVESVRGIGGYRFPLYVLSKHVCV